MKVQWRQNFQKLKYKLYNFETDSTIQAELNFIEVNLLSLFML